MKLVQQIVKADSTAKFYFEGKLTQYFKANSASSSESTPKEKPNWPEKLGQIL